MKNNKSVNVYVDEYGTYQIPERFNRLVFRKNGGFDRRMKKSYYDEFKVWLNMSSASAKVR